MVARVVTDPRPYLIVGVIIAGAGLIISTRARTVGLAVAVAGVTLSVVALVLLRVLSTIRT